MKKTLLLLLVVCMVVAITSCGKVGNSDATSPQSAISSTTESETVKWDNFVAEMEKQGIPYSEVHTLENSGLPRQEIMSMSAADIKAKLEDIEESKKVLAQEILANLATAKKDAQYVCSYLDGTSNLHLVDTFIEDVKRNDWAGFTGIMLGGTVPLVYEAAYQPDGEFLLTYYSPNRNGEVDISKSKITDIYETETFYQFSDNKGLYCSIPKVSLTDIVLIDEYEEDSDLQNMTITLVQAKEEAKNIYAHIYGYMGYANENGLGNSMHSYGVLIPENLALELEDTSRFTAIADGAAKILGEPYYQISFYSNGEFAGESYYIGAENMFMVSMVDGSLIPVSYKNAEHFSIESIS